MAGQGELAGLLVGAGRFSVLALIEIGLGQGALGLRVVGGGQDSLTRGCISMDNDKIDELFGLVSVGTAVTIVGTNEMENYVIRALRKS